MVYYQIPETHLNTNVEFHGCPSCKKEGIKRSNSKRRTTFEKFVFKSRKVHGDRYIYFKDNYIDYNTSTKIYDNYKREFFYQVPRIHVRGSGNNHIGSKGESLVKTWLINNNIEFNYSVVINNLIHGRNIDRVEIDFIVNLNNSVIWIEYNGTQHYKKEEFFYYENMTFEKQLQRDQNVREYCKNNSIKLIEIPYTYKTFESINDLLNRVILNGEDINTIIDYQNLYKID